jgi:nicotinamidase-related amidase
MKAALLIIDMLNDFVSGSMVCESAKVVLPKICSLLGAARGKGMPVIYLCDTHYPGVDAELKLWGPHAIAGTKGAEVVKELKPAEKDYIVRKRRYSGFYGTDLDLLLRELKVDTLVLTGLDTSICVRHTAADAFFRGYSLLVPRDAVATGDSAGNEPALKYLKEIYGAEVLTTEDLVARMA